MNSIRKLFAAALLAFGFSALAPAAPAIAKVSQDFPAIAEHAPSFSIKTIDGREVTSKQLAGRPYIVNIFASWCPPCRRELPGMVELQKKYAKQGFTFIGIAFRDRASTLPDFLWEMGVEYPVAMTTPELEATFGQYLPDGRIKAIPVSFVIGRDGRLLNAVSGGLTEKDFESLILKAINSKPAK